MNKGAYCLVMKLDEDREIGIGRNPPVKFPGGFYCYVGSAMNNLEKRIGRHRSREKKLHWQIDWFLEHANIVDVKKIESNRKVECGVSRDVAGLSDRAVRKFGCSDCRCETHLHYFSRDPAGNLDGMVKRWKSSSRLTGTRGKG